MDYILKNGMILRDSRFVPADIAVRSGHIVSIAAGLENLSGCTVVDLHNAAVFP